MKTIKLLIVVCAAFFSFQVMAQSFPIRVHNALGTVPGSVPQNVEVELIWGTEWIDPATHVSTNHLLTPGTSLTVMNPVGSMNLVGYRVNCSMGPRAYLVNSTVVVLNTASLPSPQLSASFPLEIVENCPTFLPIGVSHWRYHFNAMGGIHGDIIFQP